MRKTSKNILIGVVTSVFLTTLIGVAVTGYLNGPDSREMFRSGSIVGAICGLIFATIFAFIHYFAIGNSVYHAVPWHMYAGEAGFIFTLCVLGGIFGAAFGNALAFRYRSRDPSLIHYCMSMRFTPINSL